jgi:hypothetical protein
MRADLPHKRVDPHGSYRNGRFNRRVRPVILHNDIFIDVVEYRITMRQNQFRIRPRLATQPLGDLLNMAVVDMAVATGPDEFTDTQASLRSHHVSQQRITGDVERHPKE